jgi:hypothetical protein
MSDMTEKAKELLKAAAASPQGFIFVTRSAMQEQVIVDGKNFVQDQSPRAIEASKSAVQQLERMGYVKPNGERSIFTVTSEGFDASDAL